MDWAAILSVHLSVTVFCGKIATEWGLKHLHLEIAAWLASVLSGGLQVPDSGGAGVAGWLEAGARPRCVRCRWGAGGRRRC